MQPVARPRRLLLGLYVASAALMTVQQAILGHSNNLSIFRSASRRLRLDDVDGPTGLDGAGHGLASTRGPANVDRRGVVVFSSRRRHTRLQGDWSSDVCSSD